MSALRAAVLVLVVLLGAVTLLAFLDRFSWFFELLTFFRLQYTVLLFALALGATLLRQLWVTLAALALVAVNLVVLLFAWSGAYRPSLLPGPRLRVLLANVDYANAHFASLIADIQRLRPDVVGLTELTPTWRNALARSLRGYRHSVSAIHPDAYGIGLFSRLPMRARIEHFPADGPPTAVGEVRLGGRRVTVVVTHPHTPFGPHAGGLHRRQLAALAAAAPHLGARLAICGDLNTVPWSWPFRHLEAAGHLHDSHRGHPFEGSWPTWSFLLRVPIDNCLTSDGLAVVSRRVLSGIGSDHFPLYVELAPAAMRTRVAARSG